MNYLKVLTFPDLSVCTAFFLVLTFSFFPASAVSAQIFIPHESGQVVSESNGTNGRTLVLIQESHVDYGAQKSISEILHALVERHDLRLILVEAGWGDVGLEHLRQYTTLEDRKKVSEEYLKKGLISAEEYFQVTTDYDLEIWGLENPESYAENMNAFLSFQEKQKSVLKEIELLEKALREQAQTIFSSDLQTWLKKKDMSEAEKISLLGYVQYLISLSPEKIEQYPLINQMSFLLGNSKNFDAERVEFEKTQLIKSLSRILTKPEMEQLHVLRSRNNSHDELELLKSLIQLYKKHQEKLPSTITIENLVTYGKAFHAFSKSDMSQTFQEVEALEKDILKSKAESSKQIELWQTIQKTSLLKRLTKLLISPEEFLALQEEENSFPLKKWKALGNVPNLNITMIEEAIPSALAFYEAAIQREEAMIANAFQKIEKEDEKMAVLIVGGFHTEPIKKAFLKKDYSVQVVSPRFEPEETKGKHQKYLNVLKQKWNQPVA